MPGTLWVWWRVRASAANATVITRIEEAMHDALVQPVRVSPDDPPRDPQVWLLTVACRKGNTGTFCPTTYLVHMVCRQGSC